MVDIHMKIIKNSQELRACLNEHSDLYLPGEDVRIEYQMERGEVRDVVCNNLFLMNDRQKFDFIGRNFNGSDFLGDGKCPYKEKILCAEVILPKKMQNMLGITSFTMKASKIEDFVQDEFDNGDMKSMTFKIRFFMRTEKWINSLPEADI